MQNELDLEKHFSASLGSKILLCLSRDELKADELSEDELQTLSSMKHEMRRSSWLRGRKALKALLMRSNNGPLQSLSANTSQIKMPHPKLSLSHSGGVAVAVLRLDGDGIGVDIESERAVRDGAVRFYLSADNERDWCLDLIGPNKNEELLRLWTTKESLFKADLGNKDKTLNYYRVLEPGQEVGFAALVESKSASNFKYSSVKLGEFWLTVSIAVERLF